jgi:hypothetical protein
LLLARRLKLKELRLQSAVLAILYRQLLPLNQRALPLLSWTSKIMRPKLPLPHQRLLPLM